jgi:hypothetical protein
MIKVQTREEFLVALKATLPSFCDGVELGAYKGDFSAEILRVIQPNRLILVDPYETNCDKYGEDMGELTTAYSTEADYASVLQRFKKEIADGTVTVRQKYSYQVVQRWPNSFFDFVYHDASHKYKDLKRDLSDWLPKITRSGVIAGHDYVENPSFGVIRAVNEFMQERNFEMVIFNDNGGDWALKRKA